MILCVAPEMVDATWPHVVGFIEAAFENDRGDDSAELVLEELRAQLSLLWVAWDGNAVLAAATTKLIKTRRGLVCLITSCGGHDMGPTAWRKALRPIEDYARAEGCWKTRIEGRRGWAKVFPDYREAWIALEKRL